MKMRILAYEYAHADTDLSSAERFGCTTHSFAESWPAIVAAYEP